MKLLFLYRYLAPKIMETSKISREKKVELYNKLVALYPDAVLKGDTIPYTSLNGHMYSFLSKGDEVTLKLPEDERVKFIEKYKTRLAENYGIVQKEYVVVPDSLWKNTDELLLYFNIELQIHKHTKT